MILLGKSPRGNRQLTLLQHLTDTEEAACCVFRTGTRQAERFLRFFKLSPEAHTRFLLHLRVAALFHDVGKANRDFQAMLLGKKQIQSYRHEHLSALLLAEPRVRAWLAAGDLDVDIVTAAVLSHHLKARPQEVLASRGALHVSLHFDHEDIQRALGKVADVLGILAFDGSPRSQRYADDQWQDAFNALDQAANAFCAVQQREPQRWAMMLAVKAGLIVADSVASGLWREDYNIERWVDEALHATALTAGDVDEHVIKPRQRELGTRWTTWHRFQEGAATVGRRGLLLAGCGAGKTLAAWRWAHALVEPEQVGRVIFLYPTRGTATEGFRDYVAHAPEGEAALVHGTSTYELRNMLENVPESLRGKVIEDDEANARLFSLGLWNKRYFSATVDQFLGFIENSYGGLCLLPILADAAVIFDEIHSYDERMWNALVTFLERFDCPVLAMTATLPASRRTALVERCGLNVYPTLTDMRELADLEEKETRVRYQHIPTTKDEAQAAAVAAVARGERVLWVVNTVARCQELARALSPLCEGALLVYHSRFTLKDRQDRHREVIDVFRGGQTGGLIAVTTQVCEMSLDIDADVLITEHAPISSLIQRFGRANRFLRRETATLFTYAPEKAVPYKQDELDAAAAFLLGLPSAGVSQRHLSDGLEEHGRSERDASGATGFIDGGYYAVAGGLRDDDDVGVSAVRASDRELWCTMQEANDAQRDGLVMPAPKKLASIDESKILPSWLWIVDDERYDDHLGLLVGAGATTQGSE